MEWVVSFLPEGLTVFSASLLIFASFFTSGLTAAAGVGGGLLMLAIMTYLIPIAALIPVHGFVQFGSNVGRSVIQRDHINWRITKLFLVGSFFGALIGALLFVQLPAWLLQGVLGVFIIIMVWIKFRAFKNTNPFVVSLGGLVTTFVSTFAGATGPLVAVFLHNLFDEHKTMAATHGATMSIQHGFKTLAFIIAGFVFLEWLPLIALIILFGFVGSKVGTHLMHKLPEQSLKLFFKIIMSLVAIDLIRRGFFNSY